MKTNLFILLTILKLTKSSKCPEPRKPHLTSCTIFYNCKNLPSGGYVWIPAKCTQGLVFQPYLRMCVLPGDIWTCDTFENESTLVTNKYETPELLDSKQTSYLGYSETPTLFSDFIDSSYNTDDTTDTPIQTVLTPYPLIEDKLLIENSKNLEAPIKYNQQQQQQQQQPINKIQEIPQLYNSWNLFVKMQKYFDKGIHAPSSLTTFTTEPIQIFNNFQRLGINQNNILLNYLINNYIQKNNLQNIASGTPSKQIQILSNGTESKFNNTNADFNENISDLIHTNTEAENNIIMINDNLGNVQYLTIEKYKSKAAQFKSEFVKVLPCTNNIRLSNSTDCTKYYMCNPKTASVLDYKCPFNTGFNEYTRMCDVQSYKSCTDNKKDQIISLSMFLTNHTNSKSNSPELQKEQPCLTIGKFEDPTSNNHYYICYSSSEKSGIKSVRLACPNDLIFCQEKKVCTSQLLC